MFYVLTTRKSAVSYKAIFKYIKQTFALQPAEIITDLEKGLRKAINETFPNVKLRSCWFHYCATINKKCNELGMRTLLYSNRTARFFKNQIVNLPLLPSSDITRAYSHIEHSIRKISFAADFERFMDYFQDFWLEEVFFSGLCIHIDELLFIYILMILECNQLNFCCYYSHAYNIECRIYEYSNRSLFFKTWAYLAVY